MEKNSNYEKQRVTSKKELISSIEKDPVLCRKFAGLNEEWQDRFMDYCLGKRTLPVTYDPFFKRVFHPDIHPDRLSRLLSSLLGVRVRVVKVLPSEDTLLDGKSLLIMDILVELEGGALANVEVQKVPYLFPGERMSCYSADLVLRQYSRVKDERKNRFKYGDLKKVYTVVILEKSASVFHKEGFYYLHKGHTTFDTGLKLELLQEYCVLALDVFREKPYPKDGSEQTAWIAFLATESVETAQKIVKDYPWLGEIYEEMAAYLHKPEEVLWMFSEALRIIDENTVQYMVEQQQQHLKEQEQQISEQEQQISEQIQQINEQIQQLEEQRQQVKEQSQKMKDQNRQLEDQNRLLEEQSRQLEEQRQQAKEQSQKMKEKNQQLAEQSHQMEEQNQQLEETKSELSMASNRLDRMLRVFVRECRDQGNTREKTVNRLCEEFVFSKNEAEEAVQKYWL